MVQQGVCVHIDVLKINHTTQILPCISNAKQKQMGTNHAFIWSTFAPEQCVHFMKQDPGAFQI